MTLPFSKGNAIPSISFLILKSNIKNCSNGVPLECCPYPERASDEPPLKLSYPTLEELAFLTSLLRGL